MIHIFCLLIAFVHAAPGKWIHKTASAFGAKDYYLYVPTSYQGGATPLLMALHGCVQTASDFANHTGLNSVAEKYGFLALYPEQDSLSNPEQCWNFFFPQNQIRSGEAQALADIVAQVKASYAVDANRVYIAGLSAGGAMATIMSSCYSDVFSGAAIASGFEFEAAIDAPEAYYAMAHGSYQSPKRAAHDAIACTGAGARKQRLFAIQGTADQKVNPVNLDQVVAQFLEMGNLLHANISATPTSTEQNQVPGGHTYTVTSYADSSGTVQIEKVQVSGMDHAWSGGSSEANYFDLQGPDSSEMLWKFLNLEN